MKALALSCAKALGGGIVAGLGAGATAAADDTITTGEWWAIASTFAAAAYAVWRIPNRAPEDDYQGQHAALDKS